jgi:monofunctional chorismate mutase
MTIDPADELKRLRASIDNIDAAVVHMLAERFKATKAVGELKAAHNLPPADKTREASRSHACASWPRTPISILTSPKNSSPSS